MRVLTFLMDVSCALYDPRGYLLICAFVSYVEPHIFPCNLLCRSHDNTAITLKLCKGVFGTVRTEAYRWYVPSVLPVPRTSVSSVRHQYRYRTLR